ncbi:MAG: hypothetical protein COU11_02170 [Candidatus Harrisonbacteria bacterium CG10_big_fil_rev_8_21_14_0_10_49_15]|uniref:Nudix hydrolase domain-containing protein n=1 Tax=Candidatus Harrisonbacteria bacterium CG10_big_fil_rev_8_21_14_0_10_49_15 TaxID=1974587 RepID=A0A2H0UKS5_9BACT|nr:MAG: hypothetical protein COU11_02170 [Candidatus Harrisonbacteria bacterium CG10_big_fil_rev_8_21_14_0_10_49_15]
MNVSRPEPHQKVPKEAKRVFEGVIYDVYQWQQKMFDGSTQSFETLRKKKDSVVVIPVTVDGRIILLDQLQPGWQSSLVGFVCGVIDSGEEPLAAAERELREETGYKAAHCTLWSVRQFTGKTDWALYTFIAHGCEAVGEPAADGGEKLSVRYVSFDEMMEIILKDDFRNPDVALSMLQMCAKSGGREALKKELGL